MGKSGRFVSEVFLLMNRRPKIIRIDQEPEGRLIVISDIHGSLDTYERLLAKAKYRPGEDTLILLGDLVEKGDQNLALLRKVMKQSSKEKLILLMGNCDFTAKNFLFAYRLDFIQKVLLQRKKSLIHEMISEAGLPALTETTDMDQLAAALRKRYLKELSFLNDLPHVLITPKHIFAHSAINDEISIAQDFREVMAQPFFSMRDVRFSKPVIVGHMPVSEYCRQIASFNPRFDYERNIISIDGGMMVNEAGQLNALILERKSAKTISVDLLPKAEVIRSTNPLNPAPFYISWNESRVQILKEEEVQAKVYNAFLHRTFWMPKSFLHNRHAAGFTNYRLPLSKGSIVSVVRTDGMHTLVKSNGILGWCSNSSLRMIESEQTQKASDFHVRKI